MTYVALHSLNTMLLMIVLTKHDKLSAESEDEVPETVSARLQAILRVVPETDNADLVAGVESLNLNFPPTRKMTVGELRFYQCIAANHFKASVICATKRPVLAASSTDHGGSAFIQSCAGAFAMPPLADLVGEHEKDLEMVM